MSRNAQRYGRLVEGASREDVLRQNTRNFSFALRSCDPISSGFMPDYNLASILPFVRPALRRVNPSFTFTALINATWMELEASHAPVQRLRQFDKNNPNNPEFGHGNDPDDLKQSAIEAWQYLQQRGFAIPIARQFPGSIDDSELNLTNRGREWINGHEPIPELSTEYLATLQKMIPNLDDVIQEYVIEGLGSYEHDRYRSAAIMIGAASEKALYMLAEKMHDAIAAPKYKEKFRIALKRRELAELFDLMKNLLEHAKQLPNCPFDIFDGGKDHLVTLIKAIQVQRNNAVHPMIEKTSDETVRLSYLAFPYALQKTEKLRDWFAKNPNVL
jgi:hypothetical protein